MVGRLGSKWVACRLFVHCRSVGDWSFYTEIWYLKVTCASSYPTITLASNLPLLSTFSHLLPTSCFKFHRSYTCQKDSYLWHIWRHLTFSSDHWSFLTLFWHLTFRRNLFRNLLTIFQKADLFVNHCKYISRARVSDAVEWNISVELSLTLILNLSDNSYIWVRCSMEGVIGKWT